MKQFLLAFILFLIWSLLGTWFYACKIKNLCSQENTESIQLAPLGLKGFVAESNSPNIVELEADSIKNSLLNYLDEEDKKVLMITSFYDGSTEERTVGEMRATQIKKILTDYGINEGRIKTLIEERSGLFENHSKSNLSFAFDFENSTEQDFELTELSIKIKTMYFEFASVDFISDDTFKLYAQELKDYLSSRPTQSVQVTGHTDNVGSAKMNLNFGLLRAENVRKYLVSQGIDEAKILIKTEGEISPIADNEQEEGRKLNRRVEIKIK